MGKGKKPFIDKKNATTYSLTFRGGESDDEDAAPEAKSLARGAGGSRLAQSSMPWEEGSELFSEMDGLPRCGGHGRTRWSGSQFGGWGSDLCEEVQPVFVPRCTVLIAHLVRSVRHSCPVPPPPWG